MTRGMPKQKESQRNGDQDECGRSVVSETGIWIVRRVVAVVIWKQMWLLLGNGDGNEVSHYIAVSMKRRTRQAAKLQTPTAGVNPGDEVDRAAV